MFVSDRVLDEVQQQDELTELEDFDGPDLFHETGEDESDDEP